MSTRDTHNANSGNEPGAVERERGPRKWLFPMRESTYTKLIPRDQAEARAAVSEPPAASAESEEMFASRLRPGEGANVLAAAAQDVWVDRLAKYKRRKTVRVQEIRTRAAAPPVGPVIPGQKNWSPLGPSVVLNGQALGNPSVGGRVSGIAVAPGGQIVYAASANGGVFRSVDGGMSWRALMDAFDMDPTNFASTSLACGAIAIDGNDPNRVYVGTGEGDTHEMFARRLRKVFALPAYRGIGPIRSDDAGATWVSEPTAGGSPSLAGQAFFALAVDPANRDNVVAATTEGLYQRVLTEDGNPEWAHRRPGVHSSVLVASANGVTRYFAAEWGQGVVQSSDGSRWAPLGTGFPTAHVGRIALGVQPDNPDLVYALVADDDGALLGVFRFDDTGGAWKRVSNPPDVLPGPQGDYDLAIAVDPMDENLIYLGGSFDKHGEGASVWRCRVRAHGSGYRTTGDSIGNRAHSDVHVLVHTPGDPNALWVGCDGGIFMNRDPREGAMFASRNNGLACLCPNFFAQHPTDPGILLCGLQDNGTARTSGGPIWKHVSWGDGGYCQINWADPQKVLVFMNGNVLRATDGGQDHDSWKISVSADVFPWATMTEPIVAPPYNPSNPAEADVVAVGAGQSVLLSRDFGATWSTQVSIPVPNNGVGQGRVWALAFASSSRLFVGTTAGQVFRLDRSGNSWKVTRLDDVAAGPLEIGGFVEDMAIDWADSSLASIYIAFGGIGHPRHVWHFDGMSWEARSGSAANSTGQLLDVEHNAIVVDRKAPDNVYVGADIGVWRSPDRGQSWEPMPNGLPDAPVFDLQIHPTRRLLRASTHGRGLYEFPIDAAPSAGDGG
jgi:photosystem II stability/assembly factor-like uncharacterized protein